MFFPISSTSNEHEHVFLAASTSHEHEHEFLAAFLDQLVIEELEEILQSFRSLVVGKLLRKFKLGLDLVQALSGLNFLRYLVAHDNKVVFLFFKILNATADVDRAMAGDVGLDS